jgi:hypothetical protein
MSSEAETAREKVVATLSGFGRVQEHAGEASPEGVQADLANLRAAVRELQGAVLLLADEIDRQRPPQT